MFNYGVIIMGTKLISNIDNTITLQVTINLNSSMLDSEENIQKALNETGCIATREALKFFDTDGSPIKLGDIKMTSKGKVSKKYQSPWGEFKISRHVYQSSQGGATFCPLDRNARIVTTSTPKFAKMVAHKFANNSSPKVKEDLAENHNRHVARSYLQNLAEAVGLAVQSKEMDWHYSPKVSESAITTVSIGVDGTCMLLCKDGYREAMTGSISLYDGNGDRQHTIYIGATPEYGKATFFERMRQEIEWVKFCYPSAKYVGVADGANSNWRFLKEHTTRQILDFYHVTSYLKGVSKAVEPRSKKRREEWLDQQCHALKHVRGSAKSILAELKELPTNKLSTVVMKQLKNTITYFENHVHQMNYVQYLVDKLPIGSGVTEAACKTLIKERLCNSGMKWVEKGASIVLSLRALVLTSDRWGQFWSKINQYGFPIIE